MQRNTSSPPGDEFRHGTGALEYVITPREQGGGTYTQVRLTMGVTAAELLSSAVVGVDDHSGEQEPQHRVHPLDIPISGQGLPGRPGAWPNLIPLRTSTVRPGAAV